MNLLSLLVVLLLEHFRPLVNRPQIYLQFMRYANFLERQFNAGENRHGMIAWMLAVLPAALVVGAMYWVLYQISPVLGLLWNAGILYATMGFKYFSDTTSAIAKAIKSGNLGEGRSLLAAWRGRPADDLEPNELARVTIEQALTCAHRQVFAIIFWFVLLGAVGAAGAVIYRLASILSHKWGEADSPEFGEFGKFAARFFDWIDWLPARLTAVLFAVVGNFEDAVYCWRSQASSWANQAHGIILASGAGALGVKLGDPIHHNGVLEFRPELGLGEEAAPDYMESAVSLIWRALVLWLVLLGLLQLGKWV